MSLRGLILTIYVPSSLGIYLISFSLLPMSSPIRLFMYALEAYVLVPMEISRIKLPFTIVAKN